MSIHRTLEISDDPSLYQEISAPLRNPNRKRRSPNCSAEGIIEGCIIDDDAISGHVRPLDTPILQDLRNRCHISPAQHDGAAKTANALVGELRNILFPTSRTQVNCQPQIACDQEIIRRQVLTFNRLTTETKKLTSQLNDLHSSQRQQMVLLERLSANTRDLMSQANVRFPQRRQVADHQRRLNRLQ